MKSTQSLLQDVGNVYTTLLLETTKWGNIRFVSQSCSMLLSRLKFFKEAKKFNETLLKLEETNPQALSLRSLINEKVQTGKRFNRLC